MNKASDVIIEISEQSEKMLIDYEVFALSRHEDNTQKPYYMDKQLPEIEVDTYLLERDKDLLFPFQNQLKMPKNIFPR